MQSLFQFVSPPHACSYLPEQVACMEYDMVAALSEDEYLRCMLEGWRRFGATLFRPRCQACDRCRALRVDVARFQPTRSQRRAWAANQDVEVRIGPPSVTRAKLNLYDRYHAFQSERKDWPWHAAKDAASYRDSFVHNPPFTEEWTFHIGGHLGAVGYVDRLAQGMSAIYFFYEPELRRRALGTFNVLCILENARLTAVPHVYLGYYVEGCQSLEYKANFRPNEIRWPDGSWREFQNE